MSDFDNVKEIVSDNGPCFKSFEFEDYVKSYGIKQTSIIPYHHQVNGQVEQCIRMIKGMLKMNSNEPWMSLLIWKSRPVDGDLKSPAELLNECIYQSILPLVQRTSEQNQSHEEKILVKQAKKQRLP